MTLRIPDSHPNPSGDPRLDPAFVRKHGGRVSDGFETPPKGKAHPTKVYELMLPTTAGRKVSIKVKTKALSRFLIVGMISGRGVILFRCKRVEKATEILRNQQHLDQWRWLRVIDQKTKEVLVLNKGSKELEREL